MTTPGAANTSQLARLLLGAPSYAVGWQEPVYVPAPAAGAGWSYVVDGRFYERLLSVRFTFTASAVVATRDVRMSLHDANGTPVTAILAGATVTASASEVVNLTVNTGLATNSPDGYKYGPLPDLMIPPGWSWTAETDSIAAGDQFSGIVLLVQRFPGDAAVVSAAG